MHRISELRHIGCEYKERHNRLKEQFINGIYDNELMTTELTTIKKTNEIISEQVLCWAKE